MADEFYTSALNAVSDVVQNRPMPLREFDQIYMKVGDLVNTALYVASRFAGQDLVFIGDGDGVALAVMHLVVQNVITDGPTRIHVLDFDERIVNSVIRFADHYGMTERITAELYNVIDALPENTVGAHDAFYTNPPWGSSNSGESVLVFLERGIEAVRPGGMGMVVIGDDAELLWTQEVMHATQRRAIEAGFVVAEMFPEWQSYHLDDNPDLRSCSIVLRDVKRSAPTLSVALDRERRYNFYGRGAVLRIRYIRETMRLDYGKAPEFTYDRTLVDE